MTQESITIAELLQLSGGYWATCALHAGVKLDIFSIVDNAGKTAEETAAIAGSDSRATAMLLDALASMSLLTKLGEIYESTPFASRHLSRSSPEYLGHIIMHHHHLMQGWTNLTAAVTSGSPVRVSSSHAVDEAQRESFLMGMYNLATLAAPKIAAAVNLSECSNLLDLGGGPGTYAIHFCQANAQLRATVYDLSTTRSFAEKTIERYGLSARVRFAPGDYHADPIPGCYDAAWLSHVLHSEGPEACAAMLRKAAGALVHGGILMVQEFILNDEKSGPMFPALFSLNMLIGTKEGRAYSEQELRLMLENAGLSAIVRIPLNMPNGTGIMIGRKL